MRPENFGRYAMDLGEEFENKKIVLLFVVVGVCVCVATKMCAAEGKGPPDACPRLENCVPEIAVMMMTMQMRHMWQDATIAFEPRLLAQHLLEPNIRKLRHGRQCLQ